MLNFVNIKNHMNQNKAMLLKNKEVAIIGGGPGGLTLARLLQQKGLAVKVYERDIDKDARVQGATLDLHVESGLKAIEAADLMDAFKATYRPGADKGRVMDEHATIVYDEHLQEATQDFASEHFRPEIDRCDLRDILLDALKPDTVVWDSHLIAISKAGQSWKLEFKNGSNVTSDIVIGADGANSKIRPLVTPVKPFYAGITIFQGNVVDAELNAPHVFQLLKGGKIYVHSGGKSFHISSKGDGSIDFYVSYKIDEDWLQASGIDFSDRSQLLEWCNKVFTGWDEVWFELFENVSLPLLVRPQYCMPLDQSWDAQSNVTLLGDAAHIMPPSGEGVNLAMLDALELSQCLTDPNFESLQDAIAAYEKPMQERAIHEAKDSMEIAEWMHGDNAMASLLQLLDPADK
jgi:2-polyprenyl-6-methoxyphenol hydroxylase-like FAD-dependent oxidoreductase